VIFGYLASGFKKNIAISYYDYLAIMSVPIITHTTSTSASVVPTLDAGGISLQHLLELIRTSNFAAVHPTTTDLVQEVIKPKTNSKKESYLQCLAREHPSKVKAKADCFISQVWNYALKELADALEYTLFIKTNQKKDIFVWFDACCVNQHVATTTSPEQLLLDFSELLTAVGNFVMVLVNWRDPQYPKRSWCVFEAYIAITSNMKVTLAMSKQEEKSLTDAMISNEINQKFLRGYFSSINVETARAREPADEQAILQIIHKFGPSEVNGVILNNLKQWLVQGGEVALKSVKPESREAGNICMARYMIHAELGEFDAALE
jgi:hypothetical protein